MNRLRVSRQLADRLSAMHVPVDEVLREAGLPARFFHQADILVPTHEYFALWRAIAAVSRDPAIGLKLEAEFRIETSCPTAIAAVCSGTFRDALGRISRYKRLTCPEEVVITPEGGEVAVEIRFIEADEAVPDVVVDVTLAWFLAVGRYGTRGRISPIRVELIRPPVHAAVLADHFRCPIRFSCARDRMVFAARDLDQRFVTHNADLLQAIGTQLDLELQETTAAPVEILDQVRGIITRTLAGRKPAIGEVAAQLGMNARALQRRLAKSGQTFLQITEDARRKLAWHYLSNLAMDYTQVAYLLGYEDQNSFFRAFHQWEGMTPGEWRDRHMAS